ncbi:hypothetical protein CONPUDRAFT_164918 [Coniophora puteana RWD-64-598 SS2]|uniref:Peroxisomal membrane protein PEX14 n=1 Tax=Coniophora puteana (strain RWD-64-598) TaxID=741705 RepID=A0A5M3MT78_CONPW|nr:uncharacterized protein CONPUDRAFT_164918 [Coniophora puteana RWD-64-598 SS2]EIW82296.1 hypothetical protein CONPUDRAFT_164918 [Coniophora puteana RWD-64-598 SS2]
MADNDSPATPAPDATPPAPQQPTEPPSGPAPTSLALTPVDRDDLLTHARSFLAAPHIRAQDNSAKRAFLVEKGLTTPEIDRLLNELPPAIPPRTYPRPPPSNLPNLLIGVSRIVSWFFGTSAVLVFIYYRYILPRLTHSYQARHSIQSHQTDLLSRLNSSLAAYKSVQAESFADLPRKQPDAEETDWATCQNLDDILAKVESRKEKERSTEVPDVTLLRCGLVELVEKEGDGKVDTEQLYSHLEKKIPWLQGAEGAEAQAKLWSTLTSSSVFSSSAPPGTDDSAPQEPTPPARLLWKYNAPAAPASMPILQPLEKLRDTLPSESKALPPATVAPFAPSPSPAQRTLQVLSDFTGYITTQTYALGVASFRPNSSGAGANPANAQEDELRREIRVLKGLVLNRRSFLPSRPPSVPVGVSTPPLST